MSKFKDQVIWITGASSGMGEAMAMQLSAAGAKLVLSARRKEELERVQKALSHPENAIVLPLDLADNKDFSGHVSQVVDHFGRIDVLINNGGISQRGEASQTPMEIDRQIMEINYFGNVALTKAVLPTMQTQKSGYIVVISSISGKFGFFQRSAYSASKHALQGFYESLRLEEEKNNVDVSIVFPGLIQTQISVNALNSSGETHGKMDNNQAKGITAARCAAGILSGMTKRDKEIFVGGKEMKSVKLKRLAPKLFFKLIRKQSPN